MSGVPAPGPACGGAGGPSPTEFVDTGFFGAGFNRIAELQKFVEILNACADRCHKATMELEGEHGDFRKEKILRQAIRFLPKSVQFVGFLHYIGSASNSAAWAPSAP